MKNENWEKELCIDCQNADLSLLWCETKQLHIHSTFPACRSFKRRVDPVNEGKQWMECFCPNRHHCKMYKGDGSCGAVGEKK